MSLVEKYRPQALADLRGQGFVVHQLTLWLQDPQSCAFCFSGCSGCGKTSAALALASELGVVLEEEECGGLHQIASGEQTGEKVRERLHACMFRPFFGSSWHVLVVNEADAMTPNAAYTWLDVLENLPPRTCVIFTTNNAEKLPQRLLDRCEHFAFVSDAMLLLPYLQAFASEVWEKETGRDDRPDVSQIEGLVTNGQASFRRLLQLLTPLVRNAKSAGISGKSAGSWNSVVTSHPTLINTPTTPNEEGDEMATKTKRAANPYTADLLKRVERIQELTPCRAPVGIPAPEPVAAPKPAPIPKPAPKPVVDEVELALARLADDGCPHDGEPKPPAPKPAKVAKAAKPAPTTGRASWRTFDFSGYDLAAIGAAYAAGTPLRKLIPAEVPGSIFSEKLNSLGFKKGSKVA